MKLDANNLSIKKRAKTFYLASLFFEKNIRSDIKILYLFCRFVDDLGDKTGVPNSYRRKQLINLSKQIKREKSSNAIVNNFISLLKKYKIPREIPLFLIKGVLSDLKIVEIKDFEELINYSYMVAGTVGLMMCSIMKLGKNKKLYFRGIQLGIAMQITNISRDIKEDLNRKRIYLPKSFRTEKNIQIKEIVKSSYQRKKLSLDLKKLLDKGDIIYRNAWLGILKLPIKFRIPIAISSNLYQMIGNKIRKNNYDVWSQRIYLTKYEKLLGCIKTIFMIIFQNRKRPIKEYDELIHKSLIKLSKSYNG